MSRIMSCTFGKRMRSLKSMKILSRSLSTAKQAVKLAKGENIQGFVVQEIQQVPELHLTAIQLKHERTGADYLHIARDDKNNVFSVSFRTTPTDSTGVAHILEHVTLCGSRHFPCRDPFFKMLNKSLATFMNAFTGSDYTMYPFSTQNPKDFRNLLQVYLDAAFFPCLRERDFRQEGWRLEHENIEDVNSPIILKGVVFNEMKGVFSDSSSLFLTHLQSKLLPSHTYSNVSGGEPLSIPDLSYEQLKRFHSEHYHPSNARFYTYGNFPLESHLALLEKHTLSKFTRIPVETEVIEEVPWNEPREAYVHCQPDPMAPDPQKQTTVCVAYLLNKITDINESFTMNILGNLMINGPNSPFYQALIEPRIGADYSPGEGYNGHTKQSFFGIGLHGIHSDDVDKVENIIEDTFDKIIRDGFPQERIDAVLHEVELATKHQTSNFGLSISVAINHLWNHNGNPVQALRVNDYVAWFRHQLKSNPQYLQDKVKQYFKNNKHRLTLIMSPKNDFDDLKQKSEAELLQRKLDGLEKEDKENIYNEGLELAKYQQQKEDESCLPTLQISDVEKKLPPTKTCDELIDGVPVQFCEQPTNGVTYFRAVVNAAHLPDDLRLLLPLFSNVVTRMGAGTKDYKQFSHEQELRTGGLGASVHVSEDPVTPGAYEQGILFSSHCLDHNLQHMLSLWEDVFNRVRLEDEDRLIQLIKMEATDLAQGISYMGHHYAMKQASSCLNACSELKEMMSGLTQVSYMKQLAAKTNFKDVLDKLKTISTMLLKRNNFRCAVNASPTTMDTAKKSVESLLSSLGSDSSSVGRSMNPDFRVTSKQSHFILPFAVNYLSRSFPAVPFIHSDYASMKVTAKLLSSKFLHREIREQGGAYGGGAVLSTGGMFAFYSYRDPNVGRTLQTFSDAGKWLLNGDFTQKDIDEAKLGTFSEVDQPISPGNKGMKLFLNGITEDMIHQYREHLFQVSKENILSAATKYIEGCKVCGTSLLGPDNSQTCEWIRHTENDL